MGVFQVFCCCLIPEEFPTKEPAQVQSKVESARIEHQHASNDILHYKQDQNVTQVADRAVAKVTGIPAVEEKAEFKSSNTSSQEVQEVAADPTEPNEYIGSCMPANEDGRWNYLCSLNVLDTEPEQRFDDITKLCCMVFKVPICLVSLVDKERQWFKSVQGVQGVSETDRNLSFCAWTLLPESPEVLVVEDALLDARFSGNPLVLGFPHIRFYAGCPLVSATGYRLGTLCIVDSEPREFDAEACNLLVNMTEMVVRELEKDRLLEHQRQRSALLSKENTQLLRAIDCFSEGIMLCNMSSPTWPVMFVNEAWEQLTTISREEGFSKGFWDLFQVDEGDSYALATQYLKAVHNGESFDLQVHFYNAEGKRVVMDMQFRSAGRNQMDHAPLIGIPSILHPNADDSPVYYFVVCFKHQQGEDLLSQGGAGPFHLIPMRKPFDDVKLGPLLGKGAFGRVYRGTWNGAQVAVKVIEHYATEAEANQPLGLLEAGVHNQVSHPNVVQTYKHDTRVASEVLDNGKTLLETWMVLEFCNKGSVSDGVERGWFRRQGVQGGPQGGVTNLAFVLATALEVAGAMCYLHAKGILHGDLTGNNILLSSSDKDERGFTAKVCDFGLSRILTAGTESINTRSYGTVTHMPPELLLKGTMSKAADVHSFGVFLWEMYVGRRPYHGMSHGQIIHHITSGNTLKFAQGTPRRFAQLATSCFAPEPQDRPSFMDVMTMIEDMAVEDL